MWTCQLYAYLNDHKIRGHVADVGILLNSEEALRAVRVDGSDVVVARATRIHKERKWAYIFITHYFITTLLPEALANGAEELVTVLDQVEGHGESPEAEEEEEHLPDTEEEVDEVAAVLLEHQLLEGVEVTRPDEAGVGLHEGLPPA